MARHSSSPLHSSLPPPPIQPTPAARAYLSASEPRPRIDAADPGPLSPSHSDGGASDGGDDAEPVLCGLGMELRLAEAGTGWAVEAMRPGGPADASGAVRCGDRILSVNGCPLQVRDSQSRIASSPSESSLPDKAAAQGRSELDVNLLLMGR